MAVKELLRRFITQLAFVLFSAALGFGQQAPQNRASGGNSGVSAPVQTSSVSAPIGNTATNGQAPQGNQAFAVPAYLTPIHGLQGVLAESLEGNTIAAQSVEDKFNPASSIKLATALAALQTFGPDHRFLTSIWAAGPIDRATGTLAGDLVITGRDPSFHYEHAVMLARELNQLGIRAITGNLIAAPGFTMNFDWSARHSGEQFRDTIDVARRSADATRAWLDERVLLGDKESLSSVPSVVITGEVLIGAAPPAAQALLTHKSSKLVDILKVLLCYSNNFMAERIGESLGGPESVRRELVSYLGIAPGDFRISSLSGLGVNRITPQVMMKIFRSLRDELRKSKLSPADILPVAGIDPGTL